MIDEIFCNVKETSDSPHTDRVRALLNSSGVMSFTKLRADPRATEWETLHQPNVPSQKDRGGREWWFLNSHPNKLNQVIKVQVFGIVSVYSRSWRRQATWKLARGTQGITRGSRGHDPDWPLLLQDGELVYLSSNLIPLHNKIQFCR